MGRAVLCCCWCEVLSLQLTSGRARTNERTTKRMTGASFLPNLSRRCQAALPLVPGERRGWGPESSKCGYLSTTAGQGDPVFQGRRKTEDYKVRSRRWMRDGGRCGKVKDLVDASGGDLQSRENAGLLPGCCCWQTFWHGSAAGDFVPGWRLLAVIDECRACLWQVEHARQRVRAIKWPGTDTARAQMEAGRHARHTGRQWAPGSAGARPREPRSGTWNHRE
jgi:hypothetical protein